jgi:hypothetical protein
MNLFKLYSLLCFTMLAMQPAHAKQSTQLRTHRHADAPVTVTQISYHGWIRAYDLSNGIVDIIVVPAIGRIMAFQFTGHPETSPLWNNPKEAGKLPFGRPDWPNFGGDKLWPSPESDWSRHGKAWPPDSTFDAGPYKATNIAGGLRLTGPVSAGYAIRAVREIVLSAGSPSVTIKDIFIKSAAPKGNKNGFPVAIWNVTQIRPESTVYLPVNPRSRLGPQKFVVLAKPSEKPNWKVKAGVIQVTHNEQDSTKVGVDDSGGWLVTVYSRNLLFSQHFRKSALGPYLDHGTNAQVWSNVSPSYLEMELHGSGQKLCAGQSMSRVVIWHLQRLARPYSFCERRTVSYTQLSRDLVGRSR